MLLFPVIIIIILINDNNNPSCALYMFQITPIVFISFCSQSSPVRHAGMYHYPHFYLRDSGGPGRGCNLSKATQQGRRRSSESRCQASQKRTLD